MSSTVEMRIDERIRALRPVLAGTTIRVSGRFNRPPMERTSEIAALFQRAREIGRSLGMELTEGSTGGGSDGNCPPAGRITGLLTGVSGGSDGSVEAGGWRCLRCYWRICVLEGRFRAIAGELYLEFNSQRTEKQLLPRKDRFEMDECFAMINFDRPDKARLERNFAHLQKPNRHIADVIFRKRHLRVHLHGSTCAPLPGCGRLAAKVTEMFTRNFCVHLKRLRSVVSRMCFAW